MRDHFLEHLDIKQCGTVRGLGVWDFRSRNRARGTPFGARETLRRRIPREEQRRPNKVETHGSPHLKVSLCANVATFRAGHHRLRPHVDLHEFQLLAVSRNRIGSRMRLLFVWVDSKVDRRLELLLLLIVICYRS